MLTSLPTGGNPSQRLRVGYGQVDAAVAHRRPEVFVPIGTVQAVALVEVHRIGNARQVVTGAGHGRRSILDVYPELARHGRVGLRAGRNDAGLDRGGALRSRNTL